MALTAELPIWLAPGIKPGTELYTNGWGDKEYPSAEVFNFLQNRAYLALKELQEQMSPVDDHLVDSLSHVFYCGASSGVNAKVISNTAIKAYVEGLQVKFKNSDSNTGNVTVNINGLGTKKLLTFTGEEIASAELRANMIYNIVYNGTSFFLASGGAGIKTTDLTALIININKELEA